ncbi:MAG: hypothetical protein AAGM16_16305, partial [Pseudomonadota bacterium]
VANFNREPRDFGLRLPETLANRWLDDTETASLSDVLSNRTTTLTRDGADVEIPVALEAMDAMVLVIEP